MQLYNSVSFKHSEQITKAYSNSFSLAVLLLAPSIRAGIHSIYGFVRLADEIVDTFHDFDKKYLLERLEEDVYYAIEKGISTNPIVNSFQITARKYKINNDLINAFLNSMKKDLEKVNYDSREYNDYIYGSADVVGLMCLKVFTEGDDSEYEKLKDSAMSLGSAFQKVNFLRDIKSDYEQLDRKYFPGINLSNFSKSDKQKIIEEIKTDFKKAYKGITDLHPKARLGVYIAYRYYCKLLKELEKVPASLIMKHRVSVPQITKLRILTSSYLRFKTGML